MRNPRSLLRLTMLGLTLLAAPACVQSPPVFAPPAPCSSLIPDAWQQPVAHAPAPAEGNDPLSRLKAWIGFGTAEAGQLEKANGRTSDAIGIVKRCEARDAAAVAKVSRHKILGLF